MPEDASMFWAKTCLNSRGQEVPGISVQDHCLNVGWVAHTLVERLLRGVRVLLPGDDGRATAVLAALHDIGKITLGFQIKCLAWSIAAELGDRAKREAVHSVSDHALISQVFLQYRLKPAKASLWAAAIGAHHGRPKGRSVRPPENEAKSQWAEGWRSAVTEQLIGIFGPLPDRPPKPDFGCAHSDLWLLAGLVTVADWIGSNEAFFPVDRGLSTEESRQRAEQSLAAIGWPGGELRMTSFAEAFTGLESPSFQPNSVQEDVAKAAPGLVIVEATREIDRVSRRETRYYITSARLHAKELGPIVRDHWAVENGLHWVMDMTFRDDACRIRTNNAPENFVTLKHMAANLGRRKKGKNSLRLALKTAAWDDDCLVKLISA